MTADPDPVAGGAAGARPDRLWRSLRGRLLGHHCSSLRQVGPTTDLNLVIAIVGEFAETAASFRETETSRINEEIRANWVKLETKQKILVVFCVFAVCHC